jgi:uncharacterized protein
MLETLSEVQDLDLQRDAIAGERGGVPAELIAARERHQALLRDVARVRHEHDALRKRVAGNELDLKALQERRKDASESALRASTTKEMAQYQNQELQFANRAQELEEDTLPLMEELERKAEELAGLQAQIDEAEPELAALEETERERLAALEARDADLADRRARLGTTVDSALLRQYEQVRRARRGLALVGLQDGKRCGGCHVQLPIHIVQKVRKGAGVTRCPSCGRLLHAPTPG